MSSNISSEINGSTDRLEQARKDAKLLEHENVTNDDIDTAHADADQLRQLPRVRSATLKTNHHGLYIEVTPTDPRAGRQLRDDLNRTNFSGYDTFINITSA